MLDFGCLNVGFWLCGRCILVVKTLDVGCVDVAFGWVDVWTLDFGCVDVVF